MRSLILIFILIRFALLYIGAKLGETRENELIQLKMSALTDIVSDANEKRAAAARHLSEHLETNRRLMTAMLRSQNVPAKLIVGYTGSVYHAWINVWSEQEGWVEAKIYFDGKQWKLMDPTFASGGNSSESILQYIGNGDNYKAKYQY